MKKKGNIHLFAIVINSNVCRFGPQPPHCNFIDFILHLNWKGKIELRIKRKFVMEDRI